jgi:hypothetical protein
VAGAFDLTDEFIDFVSMEQKAANSLDLVLLVTGPFVGLDPCVEKTEVALVNSREGSLKRDESGADRLDFRAHQLDPGFEPLKDMIFPQSLSVGRDLG